MMATDPDGFPTREDAEKHLAERRLSSTNVKEQATSESSIFTFGARNNNGNLNGSR